jgi:hypothetical protein
MSKRLQVLLSDNEMEELRRLAKCERLTVGEWVRRTLREARANRPVVRSRNEVEGHQARREVLVSHGRH